MLLSGAVARSFGVARDRPSALARFVAVVGPAGLKPIKNPADAGFFAAAESAESGGLEGLDACGQAALMARSLVLVNQATGAETVENWLGDDESGFGAGGIVGVKSLDHLLDGGAQHRALSRVARVAHDGLLGALLGGLDIGHGGGFLKKRCNGDSKQKIMKVAKMYVKSIVKRIVA